MEEKISNKNEERKVTPKKYSEEEVNEIVAKAIQKALAANQQVIQVKKDDYVTIVYLGAIATGTTVSLGGKLGSFNRAGIPRNVPKEDFLQSLGYPVVDELRKKKSLIVLDGLTEEERERFGFNYKEGELLTNEAFFKLLDYPIEQICDIFDKACIEHKRLIVKMFYSAHFEKHDNRINYEVIKALNDCSKKFDSKGMFTPILESITKQMGK